ncbi:MAG: response regulator [Chloroflexi bacterium]|nr:response regulator [Chloroflexota bacterium]
MVVDNEGPVRDMLATMLRASGYNVSIARSGFEGIEIASALPPDLVMLDVSMPGFDGWATLEHLRTALPAVRVLMMSGMDHQARALESGAVGFLDKPYRPADLLRAVTRAMDDEPGTPTRHAA